MPKKDKRLHSFRLAPSVVGLDVGHDKISAVVLRYKRKQWDVLKTVRKNIPSPFDASVIAPKITEVLDELNVKRVVTSLSSSDTIVKEVSLPPMQNPEQELPPLMEYELERQLPIPLSEAAYDYQIIQPVVHEASTEQEEFGIRDSEFGISETKVLLAAVRRSRINDHIALMEQAGVYPQAVIPSFLMLMNSLFASGLLSPHESGFIGAVRLEAQLIDVVVIENGVLSFARSFVPKVETTYNLLDELHNTLRDFLPQKGTHQLEKLLIVTEDESPALSDLGRARDLPDRSGQVRFSDSAGGAENRDLPFGLTMESLAEALAFPHCEHKIMPDGFALGLIAGYLNMPHTLSLNLLKPLLLERHDQKKRERRKKALRFGPVSAMFVLAASAIFFFSRIEIAQEKLTEAKAAQQLFEQKVKQKADLEELSANLSRQIEALKWVDAGYPSLSYRLYQIAASTPQNIWLKEINTPPQPKRKKKEIDVMDALIVTGYSYSQSDINDFIRKLRKLPCFSEVQQVNAEERIMNKQKLLLFQLSLESEKANSQKNEQ